MDFKENSTGVDDATTCGPSGARGTYGPNDDGYLCTGIRNVAQSLVKLTVLWSEGHYPHSNAKVMPVDHPLARSLQALAQLDKDICVYANVAHSPELFAPYVPSIENQTRWDKYRGEPGWPKSDGVKGEKGG